MMHPYVFEMEYEGGTVCNHCSIGCGVGTAVALRASCFTVTLLKMYSFEAASEDEARVYVCVAISLK